jgi:imidazolonepropionase-like amidohydrolase
VIPFQGELKMLQNRVSILIALLFWLPVGAPDVKAQTQPPDLILINGRVFTAAEDHPFSEALAIKGDRVLAVGTNRQISALAGSNSRRIDVGGRVVIPGINDAHVHSFLSPKGVELQLNSGQPTWRR